MALTLNDEQLERIISQAGNGQCACPAKVCDILLSLRELFTDQVTCLSDLPLDRITHEAIAIASQRAQEILEHCVQTILVAEQWDLATLTKPGQQPS